MTALGDVFLKAGDGRITFLDTYVGQLERGGERQHGMDERSAAGGQRGRVVRPEPRAPPSARAGCSLGPEQCYSPIEPLILGGKMEPENFEVTEWRVHVRLLGRTDPVTTES